MINIQPRILELMAREIGNLENSDSLIRFLIQCGVNRKHIEYPNTKWRFVYQVLMKLASLKNTGDRRILFKIIEGACNPLMHGGNKILAQRMEKKFNNFFEGSHFWIRNGVLWEGIVDNNNQMKAYDKDGNIDGLYFYLVSPEKMDKLYVYWSELIQLITYYFDNIDNQAHEINNIYFELIYTIEELLYSDGCGGLGDDYIKPFRNISGCEFEIQQKGWNTNRLFSHLHIFLGKIAEAYAPHKPDVVKIKAENSAFFSKIDNYKQQHLSKENITQKSFIDKDRTVSQNNDALCVKLSKGKLTLHQITGAVRFNALKTTINPTSQEFKVLVALMTAKNNQATYKDLLKNLPVEKNKRNLSFIIRNIKKTLGILPAKKAQNKNCIKNIKSLGYSLMI